MKGSSVNYGEQKRRTSGKKENVRQRERWMPPKKSEPDSGGRPATEGAGLFWALPCH